MSYVFVVDVAMPSPGGLRRTAFIFRCVGDWCCEFVVDVAMPSPGGLRPIPSNRHSDGFKEVRLRMWWISMVIVLGFCCFASLFNDSRVDPGLAGRDHLKGYFFDQHFEPSRYGSRTSSLPSRSLF